MKTILSLVVLLLAVPAFSQPNLPTEIPGMAVFIPWDEPGERVYGTAVMTMIREPWIPFFELSWKMDLNWIEQAPTLTEHQTFTPIWYSSAGAILVALSDGIIALVPSYKKHIDLVSANRWVSIPRLIQWHLRIRITGENKHFIEANVP